MLETSLVKDALTMACFRRRPGTGFIFSSDRGSHLSPMQYEERWHAAQRKKAA